MNLDTAFLQTIKPGDKVFLSAHEELREMTVSKTTDTQVTVDYTWVDGSKGRRFKKDTGREIGAGGAGSYYGTPRLLSFEDAENQSSFRAQTLRTEAYALRKKVEEALTNIVGTRLNYAGEEELLKYTETLKAIASTLGVDITPKAV